GWFTIPNQFYSGVLVAGVAFGIMYLWPWIEARVTKDRREHHVLDRPRDRPWRTAIGAAALTWFTVLGFAGSDDVLAVAFGLSVNELVWLFRIALFVLPLVVGAITYKLCQELQSRDGPFIDPELVDEGSSDGDGDGGGHGGDGADLDGTDGTDGGG